MQAYRPPRSARGQLWRPAWVALGGNMGDVARAFRWAQSALHGEHTQVLATSRLYITEPMLAPGASGAGVQPYSNAACALATRLGPHQLLRCLQALERRAGRARSDDRDRGLFWGPRPLDLDLLAFADLRVRHRRLVLPHPAWAKRAFVLRPLADLGVTSFAGSAHSCAELLAKLPAVGPGSVRHEQLSWRIN